MDIPNNAIFEVHHTQKNPFPLIHYDVFRTAYGPDKKNWHNNIEILYFTGDNTTVFYDDNYYEIKNGDIFIISPNKMHQVLPGKTSIIYHVFLIDNDFCKYNDINVDELNYEKIVRSDTAKAIINKLITEYSSSDIFKRAKTKLTLLELMLYLSTNHATQLSTQNKISLQLNDSLNIAINYINTHIFDNLTLDIVSKEAGISKYYFSREFKKRTGLSFVSYVNKLRCKKAAALMPTGKYSIHQIAMMCGFDTDSYFAKTFKKHFDMTPIEYAKSQKNPYTPNIST